MNRPKFRSRCARGASSRQSTADRPSTSSAIPIKSPLLSLAWAATPGQLFVGGQTGTRFTKLVVGPPTLKLPALPSPVNVAAAFDKDRNAVEGEFTASRGEILVNGLPGKWARLSFDVPRTSEYGIRCVLERRSGQECSPLGYRCRTGVRASWSTCGRRKSRACKTFTASRRQQPTGSTPGMLLLPNALSRLRRAS